MNCCTSKEIALVESLVGKTIVMVINGVIINTCISGSMMVEKSTLVVKGMIHHN
jgi:hypothetical protein